MFSKDRGNKGKRPDSLQPNGANADPQDFESNLQPIDMSVFDKDSQGAPFVPADIADEIPALGQHDAASVDAAAAAQAAAADAPAAASAAGAAVDKDAADKGVADEEHDAAFARTSADEPADSTAADAAAEPVAAGHIDMAAVASLNTSQFVAAAVGDSQGNGQEVRDPFAPSDSFAAAAPAAEQDVAPDAAAGDTAPAAAVDADADDDASADSGDDQAADAAQPAAVAQEAAAYSRENASYEHRRGWKALSKAKKVAVVVIILIAIICGIAGGAAFALWQNVQENSQIKDEELDEVLEPVEEETIDPYWMLILGSDSRAEASDRARSDVIMLCRIDPETPRVTMVSIPRDTKVQIEGYGTQKINAAYALGGRKLAVKTISKYAGVKISHYAEIYFSGLEDLVDQLGGVTVDVPEYVSYSDVTLQPGKQKLNGHEALIFARCRKTYALGDFTRTKCQRILVKALVEKVLAQPATNYPSILTKATKCFSTDLELDELVTLATKMQGMDKDGFYSGMCPSTTGTVDGVSYTFSYINQWKLLMQKADAGEKPKLTKKEQEICGYTATNTTDLDMKSGLPADVEASLEEYWAKREAKAQAKKEKELAKQNKSASADNEAQDSSSADASTNNSNSSGASA